jgi:predicted ribosomally synthesized peptide with nif11-like leader
MVLVGLWGAIVSETAAQEFVRRVEGDETFAGELEALKADPQAVLARLHAEGFDADPAEIRAAVLDRYGAELRPEQLDEIAAGVDPTVVILGSGAGIIAVTAMAVAF